MNTISNNGYKRMHFLINKAKIWIQNFFKFLGNIYLIPLSSLKLRLSLVSWLCDRDVLRGIGYLHHVKKRCHGNFSETNIVIVNGRAKVTGMVNDISKTSLDDYSDHLHLAIIIRRSFGTKQLAIPTELELFITYISTEKPSRYASKLYTHTHTHTLTLKYLTYTSCYSGPGCSISKIIQFFYPLYKDWATGWLLIRSCILGSPKSPLCWH